MFLGAGVAAAQLPRGEESPIKSPEIALNNGPAAITADKETGAATARADIKDGKLRIVLLSESVQLPGPLRQYDSGTGYPLFSVHACEATACFLAEVTAYN